MHQIDVAALILRQQHDVSARRVDLQRLAACAENVGVREIDGELAAGDGLNAVLGEFFGNFERAEQVVDVRDGQGRLLVGQRQFQKLADRNRALTQGKAGVDVQMDKADRGNRLFQHRASIFPASKDSTNSSSQHNQCRAAPASAKSSAVTVATPAHPPCHDFDVIFVLMTYVICSARQT